MTWRRLSLCCLVVSLSLFANRPAAAASSTHVYLFRGVFNLSVGLDALAAKLARLGIAASVYGYLESGSVASQVIRDYKSGKVRTIILIGHSFGGGAVLSMADTLNTANVPVALLISLDSSSSGPVPRNVRRAVNFYRSGARPALVPGAGFHGSLRNIDVKNIPSMDHMTIQSMPSMHQRMIGYVSAARGR